MATPVFLHLTMFTRIPLPYMIITFIFNLYHVLAILLYQCKAGKIIVMVYLAHNRIHCSCCFVDVGDGERGDRDLERGFLCVSTYSLKDIKNYAYISFQRFVLGQSGSADKRKILAERRCDMIDGEHVHVLV
jgi:hypothetical protein